MKKLLLLFGLILVIGLNVSAQTKPETKEPPCGAIDTEQAVLEKDGTLIVLRQCKFEQVQPDGSTHKLWKETYGVKDGKIVLVKTVIGKFISARVEWDKP